jgi:hypothetical protein
MARTTLSYTILGQNGVVNLPSATNADAANGMNIPVPKVSSPGAADSINQLLLYIANGDSSDKTVTVRGATGSPVGGRGGTGDLAVTISHTAGGGWIGPLDATRFAQADGSVNVDFSAATSTTITAYMIPARW